MTSNYKKLTTVAILVAVSFVLGRLFTFPIPGSAGNILTLLDVGIYTTALLLGKREAAVVGGLAAFLLDLTAGFTNYMFFSLVIHGAQGFLAGSSRSKSLNFIMSAVVMVAGYFFVGALLYGWGAAIAGIWVNLAQVAVGFALALVLSPLLKRTGVLSEFRKD